MTTETTSEATLFATLVPLFSFIAIVWQRRWRVLPHVGLCNGEPFIRISVAAHTTTDDTDALVAALQLLL